MDDNAQPSAVESSEIMDNSSARPWVDANEARQEASEYLRSFGLTVPYEDMLQPEMMDEPLKLVSLSDDPSDITSDEGLAQCSMPPAISAPEQWELHGNSMSWIREACKRETEAEVEGHIRDIRKRIEANSIRRMKLELPLLRTDNDVDLRKYKSKIAAAREVRLADSHILLEPCDEEKDEGLEFPSRAHGVDRRIVRSVEGEKIQITRDSFRTLQKSLMDDWTEADKVALLSSQFKYTGLISREPITPPLSPALEAPEPFQPDEQTAALQLPSSPDSVLSGELQKAEERIFDGDQPDFSSIDMDQFDDPNEVDMIPLPDYVQKRDDLKMEEPLLPAVSDEHTATGQLSDLGVTRDDIPLDPTTEDDVQCRETDKALAESLKETAAVVMMEIEQEKLEPLDATIRVEVPVLDFGIPEPEWCKLRDPLAIFRCIPREFGVDFNATEWSTKRVDQAKMNWMPWKGEKPEPAREEPICDKALLAAFLDGSGDAYVPTSWDYARKRPGLAILDDNNEEEEELQQVAAPSQPLPPPQGDWMSLLKKRKQPHNTDEHKKKAKRSKEEALSMTRNRGPSGNLLVQEEDGAAATLLDNYLEMRAPKKTEFEPSPFFKKKSEETPGQDPRASEKSRDKRRPPNKRQEKTTRRPDVPTAQLDQRMVCPEMPHLDKPVRMIVALNMPRDMTAHLERLLPGLQLVDRDYNAHNTSVWLQGSVTRTEVVSPLADEADVTPSPCTGIILTTLIKVRQKQIPGAKRAHLTTRVESVAARYERLVVLVSEGNKLAESTNPLSASDAAAFTGFQGFCATLPAETTVYFVGGGVQTLARWTAAVAAGYAAGSHHLQGYLREEETQWELFLRRAGMNAYAAQVVLEMLRVPEGEPWVDHRRSYGLPAFVKMTQEQRQEMFEGVLGGRRVLAAVGRVADADWKGHGDVGGGKAGVDMDGISRL